MIAMSTIWLLISILGGILGGLVATGTSCISKRKMTKKD